MESSMTMAQKIDLVLERLDRIEARHAATAELYEEFQPILKAMMSAGTERMADLEERGYFTFVREIGRAVDSVVRHYSAEDVRLFADHAVTILDTVRNLTQPEVLGMVDEATEAVQQAGDSEPVGAWGMYKATKDADVRKGMSVVFEVVRQIGKTASRMEEGARAPARERRPAKRGVETLRGALAPRSRLPAPKAAEPKVTAPVCKPAEADAGVAFDEGWNLEKAAATAAALGLEWTDTHRQVVEFARADYLENGASPNVRRITQGSGVDVRTLYALFPGGPGKKVAQVAGIPKPGGCI